LLDSRRLPGLGSDSAGLPTAGFSAGVTWVIVLDLFLCDKSEAEFMRPEGGETTILQFRLPRLAASATPGHSNT
jgi:hypothetical protein